MSQAAQSTCAVHTKGALVAVSVRKRAGFEQEYLGEIWVRSGCDLGAAGTTFQPSGVLAHPSALVR